MSENNQDTNNGRENKADSAANSADEKSVKVGNQQDEKADDAGENHADEAEKKDGEAAEEKKPRSKLPIIIVSSVLLIAGIGGLIYWLYARQFESTDDAFIDGDVVQISPKIASYVTKVYVKSNQEVHKGDLLLELNTQDYEARLEQAKAQLRAAEAQKNQSQAQVNLTKKTTQATTTQARSNVETAKSNVQQTARAADAKQSQIRQAQTAVKTAQANLAQARTQIPQAQANLNLAQKEYNRRLNLYDTGDISRQVLDQGLTALQTAQAQLNAAQKEVDAAQSRVGEAQANVSVAQQNYQQSLAQVDLTQSQVNESSGRLEDAAAAPERIAVSESQVGTSAANIETARTAVAQAELDLSYAKIYAPEDGYIARKNVEEGQFVQPGAALLAVALSDEIWVVANFKETQLELMRVGQAVELKVDAYPNEKFEGKIESFQAGTGSRFSVLPTENATGNYVKVVQRVPVKIVFDKQPSDDKAHLLAPGMSVEPSVKVR